MKRSNEPKDGTCDSHVIGPAENSFLSPTIETTTVKINTRPFKAGFSLTGITRRSGALRDTDKSARERFCLAEPGEGKIKLNSTVECQGRGLSRNTNEFALLGGENR